MHDHNRNAHLNAIDIPRRYLRHSPQEESRSPHALAPAMQRVFIAVAAGLENARDVAAYTALSPQKAASQLLALERRHLLQRAQDTPRSPRYTLSPAGLQYLKQLCSFLPHA